MIRLNQIKLKIDYKEEDIKLVLSKQLRIYKDQVLSYKMVKRSIDARKKPNVYYVCVFDVEVTNEKQILARQKNLEVSKPLKYEWPTVVKKPSPIIVGFGPAGIFAAYIMAELGLNPIIFERGEDVDKRTESVEQFWKEGILNTSSNVQFGEGGAGTFSDGKLTTRSKDSRGKKVLEILVEHGAPDEILYSNKPHVGTDILKNVVKSIRNKIISLGGQVHFSSYVESFIVENDSVKGVIVNGKEHLSEHVVVAVGHSARDTYETLYNQGLSIEQKPFAMGVRIEHHQDMIDKNQYGSLEHRKHLGASDYKLTHKASNGRSVYSFCVCPGGMVVASSSEDGGLVVNGMSEHARDQKNVNAALLVQIQTDDFGSDHPLAGVAYQRKYEKLAFELGGSNYTAPAESVGSFLNGELNQIESILPSYRPSVKLTSIKTCLPEVVYTALQEGLVAFDRKIKGFANNDAILTAIESRSSAPIRMNRSFEEMESNIKGLFPIGEGAGYAGGIISSAIDGIKVAEIIATV